MEPTTTNTPAGEPLPSSVPSPPSPVEPVLAAAPVNQNGYAKWLIILLVLAALGWGLSGFFGYSLKKTSDQLKQFKDQYSQSVTISEPVEVGGKIVYKTTTKTIHDTRIITERIKTTETWKTGVTLGVAACVENGRTGVWASADVLPLGPGTVQVEALVAPTEQWGGLGYRLLF